MMKSRFHLGGGCTVRGVHVGAIDGQNQALEPLVVLSKVVHLQGRRKSSFPMAMVCTARHQISVSASTNTRPEKDDLIPL